MTIENHKDEAIPKDWIDEPEVSVKTLWFDDGEEVYPRRFVEIGGQLVTFETALDLASSLVDAVEEETVPIRSGPAERMKGN